MIVNLWKACPRPNFPYNQIRQLSDLSAMGREEKATTLPLTLLARLYLKNVKGDYINGN